LSSTTRRGRGSGESGGGAARHPRVLDRAHVDEYEAVRRIPTHFVVAPGHDVPEIERVVEKTERYVVVEKVGDAGGFAVQLDPRSRQGGTETSEPRD
jgi:hypothetical protein